MPLLGPEGRPEFVTQCSLEAADVDEVFTTETSKTDADVTSSRTDGQTKVREVSTVAKTVLVICCASINFICIGFAIGLSVIFVEILKVFDTTRAITSLMQTTCIGIIYTGALFIGPIVQRLTPGPSIILGGLLTQVGLLTATFALNVPTLIVSVGLVTAVGLSFAFIASYMVVSKVMGKRQSVGVSVITAGSGLGSFFFPQINTTVIEVFGWRGTFLIVSGITFNLCVLGSVIHVLTKSVIKKQEPTKETKSFKSFRKSLNLHIFKNKSYVIFLVFQLPLWTFVTGQMVFLVDVAETRGYDLQRASLLLSAMAIAYIPGSLLSGVLISLCHIPALMVVSVPLFLMALSSLGWTLFTSYGVMVTLAILTGLFLSLADAAIPVGVLDITGQEEYSSALSFMFGISGTSDIISGPISGSIRDITGTYIYMFYLSALFSGSVSIVYTCLFVYRLRIKKRTKVEHINQETTSTKL